MESSFSSRSRRAVLSCVHALLMGIGLLSGAAHAQDLVLFPIGGDSSSLVPAGAGGYDMTARGRGSVTGTDQLAFAGLQRDGDFDLAVRVADLAVSDPFVRAGLMVRTGTEVNAAFAAAYVSSGLAGVFFETRAVVGGGLTRASALGGFPSVTPDAWVRVRREGVQVTGYGSVDGVRWTRLGSAILPLGTSAWVGLAVSSQDVNTAARAQFREYKAVTEAAEVPWVHVREWAVPSSRRTGLVISEIQYSPGLARDGVTEAPEFIEIANHGDIFVEMTGWRLTGGVEFRFPDGFVLEAGAVAVITGNPDALRPLAGSSAVLGPWEGGLAAEGEELELRDGIGAVKLHLEYSADAPWPAGTDGTGHSLVLVSPSYGEEDPRAWGRSFRRGGSPGWRDPVSISVPEPVVLNEILAHTDLPQLDTLELYNRSTNEVDLSGLILTDDIRTNRFRIPDGTRIGAGRHVAFDETGLGFRLSAAGEEVYLLSRDGTRVLDAIRFGAQENGVSSGRVPDGSETWRRLAVPTPGVGNGGVRAEPVVINEIFYNPPGGDADEFIELHHRGTEAVDLGGWRIRGGVDYEFPAGTRIEPGGFLVVAKDPQRLRENHPGVAAAVVFGAYSGTLGNGGDVVRLTKPDEIRTTNGLGQVVVDTLHINVGEVTYVDGGAWGRWSDGGGSSLELTDPDADPALAASWADSDESGKSAWTSVEWTGTLDNGNSANGLNRLFLGLLNDGECLVDDLAVIRGGTTTNMLQNPGFELGTQSWLLGGNHAGSSVEASAAATGSMGLRLRAQGGLDTGVNSIRGSLGTGLTAGNTVTLRARVRWIAGWPELLFRIRGNFADHAAPLAVPRNLGTPGAANSRRVANAGPSIHGVTHFPPLPRAGESVLVTARAQDPDVVTGMTLRYRADGPSVPAWSEVSMRDDGQGGDALAGDGIFTGRIPAPGGTALNAFTIVGTDGSGVTSVWPRNTLGDEALVRWGDTIPFGSFPHVHLWATTQNRSAPGGNALNNAYRRCTIVYGNTRVVYNCVFRDKGSPFHSGSGDLTARMPDDERLHGVSERLFSRTGNGGVEETGLRGRVASWLASQMGVPSLHGRYQFLHVNGISFANVVEDQEEPDHRYAEHHYPEGGEGDLYKISIWFEFSDGNTQFQATQATMERFLSGGQLKLARYRWNWERRAQVFPESNYQTIFDLVNVLNSSADAGYVSRVLQHADVEQWMHVFAFHRVTGNWDSWTYNVGQNMYLYRQPGGRAVLFPWDIDFVLGLGDGPTAALWGGQDPVMNSRVYDNPAFRRMLWRALDRAASGPMQAARFQPVIDAYRAVQQQNNVTGVAATTGITSYLNGRRAFIQSRYNAANVGAFAITSNGGADFQSGTPTVTLAGSAPLAVADIAVNGARFPVSWTGFTAFSVTVPLTAATNDLQLVALDRNGVPIAGMTDSIRVTYPGAIPQVRDWVVLNEVHYNPAVPGTSFVELHNRNTATPFNLGGYRVDGIGYTFPSNAVVAPGGFLLLVGDRIEFGNLYGAGVPVFDEFPGRLDNDGERLRLLPPSSDVAFSEVRYLDRAPWPVTADGQGPSLQLVDATQDTRRPANWAVMPTNSVNRTTPAAANATRAVLPPFPAVWINEVFPVPPSGVVDNAGDADPLLELFNPGAVAADLSGVWLSDSLGTPLKWAFPAGTTVPAGGHLRVWLDNEAGESAPGHVHAGFRIAGGSGVVVMSRMQGSPAAPAVLDWIEYNLLPPGRGFGSVPDGDPYSRRPLYVATPGAANSAFVPPVSVVINELMAQNTATLRDPADTDFDDWIELYNPGAVAADLSGYFLTDDLANPRASALPPGTVVPAGGFLLVWADGETAQNDVAKGWIHAGFSLARGGESVGLYAPDGSLVDAFTFGEQMANVSVGRYPDGPDGDWIPLVNPSPENLNFVPGGNQPPRFGVVAAQTLPEGVRWTLRVAAVDPDPGQAVHYTLGADSAAGVDVDPVTGDVSWTPTEVQGPGSFLISVRATDNGTPPLGATLRIPVTVTEVNSDPFIAVLPDATVGEGELLAVDIDATDADVPVQPLVYSLGGTPPPGVSIDPQSGLLTWVPAEEQGPAEYAVLVRVRDDGSPAGVFTRSLRVVVEERDNVPVLEQPGPQIVDEGSPLRLELKGSDPEGAPVRYSLVTEAPAGLTLDAVTGVLRWTPTEEQGPGNYPLIVRVTEQSAQSQTAQVTFSVIVREANQPPSLEPLPSLVRFEGDVVEWVAGGTDPDRPAQELSYAAAPGAVPGKVAVEAATGRITWTLPEDIGATNLSLVVRVGDGGSPVLQDESVLEVQVLPRFRVAISEIMNRPAAGAAGYVELANPSAVTSWDLTGSRLLGRGFEFVFPAGSVLSPGARLCVASDVAAFRAAYGAGIPLAGGWGGVIGRDGDDLRLIGVDGELLDRVTFAVGGAWPELPTTGGVAFQLIDLMDDNARPGNWAAAAAFTGSRRLVEYTSLWKYLDGGAPTPSWTAPDADESGWKQGGGLLFNESAVLAAPKTTELPLGRLAYYFRGTFVLPAKPVGASLSLTHFLDDGAVFYLNGVELTRFNMPAGEVTPTTLANATVGDAAASTPVTLPGELLRSGPNVLAVEVHQSSLGSSDIVFGAQLELVGGTLPSLTPGAPNSVVATLPEFPRVYLNEISPVAGALKDGAGEAEPWLELHNAGSEAVDLSGWMLTGSSASGAWVFPGGSVVAAGQRRIVFLDAEPLEGGAGEWHASFRPAAGGGWITLARPATVGSGVVDWIEYGAVPAGQTLAWVPEGGAGSRRWGAPTPGVVNAGAVAPPAGLVAEVSGSGVLVRWAGAEGFRYRLESAPGIGGPWQTVGRAVGAGFPLELGDPQAPAQERYYRVTAE